MSLVNKMLRDLDARRASDAERYALPTAVTPLAARQKVASPWRLRFLLMLMLIVICLVIWWQWQKLPSADRTEHIESSLVEVASTPMPPPSAATPTHVATVAAIPLTSAPIVPPQQTVSAAIPPAPTEKTVLPRTTEPLSPPLNLSSANHLRADTQAPLKKTPSATGEDDLPATNANSSISMSPGGRHESLALISPRISKQEHVPSPTEQADALYQQGREANRTGRLEEAITHYQTALSLSPEHIAARQSLASLLISAQQWNAVEPVLREGISLPATRMTSTLTLARLFVERNQAADALDLMQQQAASGEKNAEYQGFLAALLNRAGRASEAAKRYQLATQLAPTEARWWAGLGIALETDGQSAAAHEAYLKARSLPGLPPELAVHVEQRLR